VNVDVYTTNDDKSDGEKSEITKMVLAMSKYMKEPAKNRHLVR